MTRNYQDEPQVFRVATSSLCLVSFHQLLRLGVGDPWGPNLVVLSRTRTKSLFVRVRPRKDVGRVRVHTRYCRFSSNEAVQVRGRTYIRDTVSQIHLFSKVRGRTTTTWYYKEVLQDPWFRQLIHDIEEEDVGDQNRHRYLKFVTNIDAGKN